MGTSTEGAERGKRYLTRSVMVVMAVLLTGETSLGGERPKSWNKRAVEARDEAMRSIDQYDLAGAATAQSEFVLALTHLLGSDHPHTKWAAAFADEWRELSQLPCDRQYAYLECVHFLFAEAAHAEVDRAKRLADLIDTLVVLESLRDESSFTALFALVELGGLTGASGDADGAIDYYMAALNGVTAACGAGHPETSRLLERLAATYYYLDEYEESERWMREALAIIRQEDFGESAYLAGLLKLAAIQMARGNLTEAEGVLVWARRRSEKRSICNDALKGEIRFALAYVLARHGNFKEAAEMLDSARRHFEKLTDARERHLERTEQLALFLEVHAAAESSPSCEFSQPGLLWEEIDGELRLKTSAASEEQGGDHSELLARLEATRERVQGYLECGELDKVVAIGRERLDLIESSPLKSQPLARHEETLLDEWKEVLGMEPESHLKYVRAYASFGLGERLLEGAEPDFAAAEDCLLEGIVELEALGLSKSLHLALAFGHLCRIRIASGDDATALTYAKRAHEILAFQFGEEDPLTLDAIEKMVRLHIALGELEEANSLLRESLPIARRVVRMNSPEYVGLLLSGARMHTERGRLAEGEGMCHQATELASRLLERSPGLEAECQCLSAEILLAHGELNKAEAQFAKTWRLYHQSLEPHGPVRHRLLAGHARTLAALGREAEAKERLGLLAAPANDDVMAQRAR